MIKNINIIKVMIMSCQKAKKKRKRLAAMNEERITRVKNFHVLALITKLCEVVLHHLLGRCHGSPVYVQVQLPLITLVVSVAFH